MSLAFLPSLFRPLSTIVALWILTSAVIWADDKPEKALAEAPLFAFGGIGAAGTTSPDEIAFRKVLTSETAAEGFARILKSGTPEAQCYALVGLRLKDRAVFDEQVKHFAESKREVQTCAGCMMSKQPMSSVVANIQKGSFDERAKSGPSRR